MGDYLRIIATKKSEPPVQVEELPADTVQIAAADSVAVIPRPAGYTRVSSLQGTFDIAVLLPFYLSENAIRSDIDSSKWVRGKRVYKPVRRSDEWIYFRSTPFIEMYQGILLAVDTLRSLGLSINLFTFDIKSDTFELTRLINRGQLAGMDLIIGPVYSRNLAIVADYGR